MLSPLTTGRPRVFITGIFHETHTFLPGCTTADMCELISPEEVLAMTDPTSPMGTAVKLAAELGWDLKAGWDLRAIPGPMMAQSVVDDWLEKTCVELQAARAQGLDGFFLILHGAMVSEAWEDPEGEILSRFREIVGPHLPIVGVTDLHANFTPRMAQLSNALLTYHKNPHTDGAATSARAVHLLQRVMREGLNPVTVFQGTDIMWPPTGTATASDPMLTLEQMARDLEVAHPEFLAVNVHAGFSFADIHHCGVSFSLVTLGDSAAGQSALKPLLDYAWQNREAGNPVDPTFEASWPQIEAALLLPQIGPVVVAEPSDNIGGGAPGDGTGLLRELIKFQVDEAACCLWDPAAVEQLVKLAPGSKHTIVVGGHSLGLEGAGPLALDLELTSASDGFFRLEDPHSHMATVGGLDFFMGPTVLTRLTLESGGHLHLLLTSNRTPPMDLAQWRSQGLAPETLSLVAVKAAVAHRQAYDPISKAAFTVATPGPCGSDLRKFNFQKVRRPIYPLDSFK